MTKLDFSHFYTDELNQMRRLLETEQFVFVDNRTLVSINDELDRTDRTKMQRRALDRALARSK